MCVTESRTWRTRSGTPALSTDGGGSGRWAFSCSYWRSHTSLSGVGLRLSLYIGFPSPGAPLHGEKSQVADEAVTPSLPLPGNCY